MGQLTQLALLCTSSCVNWMSVAQALRTRMVQLAQLDLLDRYVQLCQLDADRNRHDD